MASAADSGEGGYRDAAQRRAQVAAEQRAAAREKEAAERRAREAIYNARKDHHERQPVVTVGNGQQQQQQQGGAAQQQAQGDQYARRKWWHAFRKHKGPADGHAGPAWVPDAAAPSCQGCNMQFDWVKRRHHCRYCGKVFCSKCTQQRALLPSEFKLREPQRVCAPCAQELAPYQGDLVKLISNQQRMNAQYHPKANARFMNSPFSTTLGHEIRKAAYSINNFFGDNPNALIKDQTIPRQCLQRAKGLAFLTVFRAGFMFTGRIGTGLIMAKLADGVSWSAPSAIGTLGMGWGAQIGGELTDFIIVLNTDKAVESFGASAQVSLGAELGVSAGPIGRSAAAAVNFGDGGVTPCYSYSQSKGLFAGISLEGAAIVPRNDVNLKFYGRAVERKDLLSGRVPPPPAAEPLYAAVRKVMSVEMDAAAATNNTAPENGTQGGWTA